jgi:hypothetical protein
MPLYRSPASAGSLPDLKRVTGPERRTSDEAEDEESRLLRESLSAVNKFMSGGNTSESINPATRYRRDEDSWRQTSKPTRASARGDDSEIFDAVPIHSSKRPIAQKPGQQRNKVMTPAEFEKYRKDKERQDLAASKEKTEDKSDDEDHYEDDEDDVEKARQQEKQRRKQEAQLSVYRQQMTKVTGESTSNISQSRPSLQISFSSPSLPNLAGANPGANPRANPSEGSDEDEEVPLAILAAHGFPNKNRPPTRLSPNASNPNLRLSQQPSYQRPGSVVYNDAAAAASNARLPAFARKLPEDPFVGAGLVRNSVRESFALGGGAAAPTHAGAPLPPGGLVGVIANEERSRAMRRGSPFAEGQNSMPPAHLDPLGGIPSSSMYPNRPNSTVYPNRPQSTVYPPMDPAQMQQMQQFMQMQMQFMQMMSGQGGNVGGRPTSQFFPQPMGNYHDMGQMQPGLMPSDMMGPPDMMRRSFVATGSSYDLPRIPHTRTMSMVQPSSASWVQPPPPPVPMHGYAPSIAVQGAGYAPSIAPSERSNIGLPSRYRPVSHVQPPPNVRSSSMPGALNGWSDAMPQSKSVSPLKKSGGSSDNEEDDEEGWQAMKAKREKKRSLWRTKKTIGDIASLIT